MKINKITKKQSKTHKLCAGNAKDMKIIPIMSLALFRYRYKISCKSDIITWGVCENPPIHIRQWENFQAAFKL